ncbi:LacI family DNA-binding transcriptional regulator [Allostreptomyces psammosilenae]|uniref:DNA-binding LacI/PurR family transcriptional regulator n=1 Tax=Allostreptomyces psammosilenae TaxID=1892865 RepID=A0A852ZTA9_9ACTN|nr:LacI family DNA-binding transcriptional regulator [Allostreptomyces psammosilenae]NYI05075.1 DNA-binding LacI/PurR family transcriptional regulator [Allostreptomyces psammosilenae]
MDVTGHTQGSGAPTQPPRRRAGVSIRDVARAAGVSYQTVSRVINESPSVAPHTRERVLAAVERLGFRRSATAHALAVGQVRTVTVLTGNTTLYGYASTLRGIEQAARATGYAVGIRVLEGESPSDVRAAVQHATDAGGGVLVIAYDRAGQAVWEALPEGLPAAAAVEAPAEVADGGARPRVWIDDRAAAAEATRYLLALGHRTVHHVAIPASVRGGSSPRALGWSQALREAGAVVPGPAGEGWDATDGHRAGRELARDPAVTAVLCGNDDLALGVVRAMHEAGRSVPASVSVMGFDDAPHAAFLTPALSTVRLDFAQLGRACFHGLLTQLAPDAPSEEAPPLTATLVRRESTAPPPP